MNGILFLGEGDFALRRGEQGNLLSLVPDLRSLVLILFYSNECPHCDSLINKFKQLPQLIHGCLFAMVNINRNMSIVEKSQQTVAPITYVPDMILYVHGNPYIRYDGSHDITAIRNFISEVYQKIQKTPFIEPSNKTSSSPPQNHKPKATTDAVEIPAYTIGKPFSGDRKSDRLCYLSFDHAYVSSKN